jgi:glycosyltransferase involved in cell wall biosynthesis
MSLVDVIIPTFNRAALLETTIPSYLQTDVRNIYLIDDCSTDETSIVAAKLCSIYPQIIYRKLSTKGRQMGAKNMGLNLCSAQYVYFGDDDSILIPQSIKSLLIDVKKNTNSIIAARHIYMGNNEVLEEIICNHKRYANCEFDIFNPKNMKLDLSYIVPKEFNIPFCQACFLVDGDVARSFRFNEKYIGTCFREETDFIICLRKSGLDLIVCNEALQINLPRSFSSNGGTSSVPFIFRHFSELINEFRFFWMHGDYLKKYVNFSCSPMLRMIKFFLGKMNRLLK